MLLLFDCHYRCCCLVLVVILVVVCSVEIIVVADLLDVLIVTVAF